MKGIAMTAEPVNKPVIPNLFRDLSAECNDVSDRILPQVIKILSRSDQTLVWFDSLICPVRKIVPSSYQDKIMHAIVEQLKKKNIVEYATGFWSLCDGGFLYLTSCSLTDDFFMEKPGTQLTLF